MVFLFLGGCALNEIARKEDIVVAKTDISEEILKIRKENRALAERLDETSQRVEELTHQIEEAKGQSANSAKFIQQKLQQLNNAIEEAKKDQEKISTDFSGKIQVVLDEVSKENTALHQRIDKLGEKKQSVRSGATPVKIARINGQPTYKVVAGDTLAKIAKRFGVSIPALLDLNAIKNPDDLRPGQRLILPADARTSDESRP